MLAEQSHTSRRKGCCVKTGNTWCESQSVPVLWQNGDPGDKVFRINLENFFSFSFLFWHYSHRWTSASTKIALPCSRSCYSRLQFLTPTFVRSSSTDFSQLNLGFPTRRVPSGLSRVSFLKGSSSCILQRRPSHLNILPNYTSCLY